MKTHTTNSQAINKELQAMQQNNFKANRCPQSKSTDKTTIISISILLLIPALVITLNYFGLIHNI